jgi:RNA polymerase primary sigma factor
LRTIIAKVLTSKEQWIINSRYGLGEHKELTLAEIGAALRVSKERIRQIQAKIILKLRKYL